MQPAFFLFLTKTKTNQEKKATKKEKRRNAEHTSQIGFIGEHLQQLRIIIAQWYG